ncbi:hypothetical protein BDV11DRAFT_144978 [Aspergillus similis]
MSNTRTNFRGLGQSIEGTKTHYEDKVTHTAKAQDASDIRQVIHGPKETPVAGRDIKKISYANSTPEGNKDSTRSSEPAKDPRAVEQTSLPANQIITSPVRSPVARRDIGSITY